jgi:hypothetical protein
MEWSSSDKEGKKFILSIVQQQSKALSGYKEQAETAHGPRGDQLIGSLLFKSRVTLLCCLSVLSEMNK